MRKLGAGIVTLLCLVAAAGCTTNKSIANVTFSTQATLQMAVGTINDSGGFFGSGPVSLNVVTSFRNQLGNSAYIHPGTSTLTGPGALSTTLGSLFSYGGPPGSDGFTGLAPAYNPPQSLGQGYATGIDVTGAPAAPGAYSLADAVTVNGGTQSYSATATLPAVPTVLGNEATPTYISDGTGGGTITFSIPAGVTESLVVVMCDGTNNPPAPDPCALNSHAEVASIESTTTTAVLPDGLVTPTDKYNAVVLGADYPLVEAGPPTNTQPNPTLTGIAGSVDVTDSGPSASFQP